MSIAVKDILKLDSLQKIRLVGGAGGMEKSVEWIYVAECFEDPLEGIKWLQGGEIIIITGVGIKGNMDVLGSFLRGINEKNGAGLIVNVGPYIEAVSEEVVQLADQLEIPLFTLPWEVKLVEVSREISNAIVLSRIEENSLTHFLGNILFGDGQMEGDALEKAAYFGYNLAGECAICVIDIDGFERYLKRKNLEDESSISKIKIIFRKLVQDILERHALKVPIIDKDDSVIIFTRAETNFMVRFGKALSEIQATITQRIEGMTVSVGIGSAYQELPQMKQSLAEAEMAIQSAKCEGKDNAVTRYQDIGIYGLLFTAGSRSVLENYFEQVLGPISKRDQKSKDGNLVQILETYLNENCNIKITAEKLFLHRNTLKYKIQRIEELLGCNLHDFDDCMKIKMALYVQRVLR